MALKKYGVRTVDNNTPDPVTGNVNSSGTGGGASKFGKDDVLAAENREFDAAGNTFKIKGATEFEFKGQESEGFIDFNPAISSCYLNGEISPTKFVFIQDNNAPFVTLGVELTVSLSIDGTPTDVLFTGQALPELSGAIVLAADAIASTTRSCLGYYGFTTVTSFKVSVESKVPDTNNIAFFDGENLKRGKLDLPEGINSGASGRFTKYDISGNNIENSSLSETTNEIISTKDVRITQDLETTGETVCDGGVDDKSGLRLKRLRNDQAKPFDYALTEEFPWGMVYDTDGNLFVSNRTSKSISKILPDGSSSQFAYDASLSCVALAIDSSNNLYTNGGSNKIYKITPLGVVSEFATVGSENYNFIFDSAGNLFAVCSFSQELWKVTPAGVATLFHSFGASGAGTVTPNRITIDSDDNLYVTGFSTRYIYKITPAGVATDFYVPVDASDGFVQAIIFNAFDNYIYGVTAGARIARLNLSGVKTLLSDNMSVGSDTIAIDRNNNVYFASTPTSTPGNVFIFRQSNQEVEFYCEVNYPIRLAFNGVNNMFACSATDDKVYIIKPVPKKMLTLDSNGRVIFFEDDIFGLKGTFYDNFEAKENGLIAGDYYNTPIDPETNRSYICQVIDNADTKFKLFFLDIDATMAAVGIADKNNVDDWNAKLNPQNPYTEVVIEGNNAILTVKDRQQNQQFLFFNMQLIMFEVIECDENISIDLRLNNNNITTYNPTYPLPYDSALYIPNNGMTSFNNVTILDLNTLDLSNNSLTSFDGNTISVGTLELVYNNFTEFNPTNVNVFQSLSLRFNELDSIGFNTSNLIRLDLGGNQFTESPIQSDHNALQFLDLSTNLMTDFDCDYKMPALLELYVGGSQFTTFNPVNIILSELNILQIQQCPLMTTFDPTYVWKYSKKLTYLMVAYSGITSFNPSVKIESEVLQSLVLASNPLTEFDPTIPLPYSIKFLQIGGAGSMLTKFNPTQPLPVMLETLSIPSNPITTANWNSETAWIAGVADRRILDALGTADTIVGTTTESLLLAKNWSITH